MRAFEGALRGAARPTTQGFAALLALLADLAEQEHLATVDAECRAHLSGFGGSSKLTKAARALLCATAAGDPERFIALAVAAREVRLKRLKDRKYTVMANALIASRMMDLATRSRRHARWSKTDLRISACVASRSIDVSDRPSLTSDRCHFPYIPGPEQIRNYKVGQQNPFRFGDDIRMQTLRS